MNLLGTWPLIAALLVAALLGREERSSFSPEQHEPSLNKDHEIEAYHEACQLFRHYATIRFAILTAFIAITGGLLVFAFPSEAASPRAGFRFYFASASGIVIAVLFGIYEIRNDQLMRFFAKKMHDIAAHLDVSAEAKQRPPVIPFFTEFGGRPLMLTVYGAAIAFWLVAVVVLR